MRNLLFLIIILSAGCSQKDKLPESVYPPPQMAQVLIDIHLLEQKIDQLNISYDSQQVLYNHFEPLVFADHGVDSARYRESLNYYIGHVSQLEQIYKEVVDSLIVREKTRQIE